MVEQGEGQVLVASASYNQYPAPLANYEDIVANRQLFMATLEKLHATMTTKFMIPIIGGRDLDLHKLFWEVTSRGGLEKVLSEKRWKDVTATFNFPSTATNATFVLRKYYYSLLQHYEQIYYFKAQGWTPSPKGTLQSHQTTPIAAHGSPKMSQAPPQVDSKHQPRMNATEFVSEGAASSGEFPVIGVIDGKFENGYLITMTVGKERLKGVLYQAPPASDPTNQTGITSTPTTSGLLRKRRRRRRKSEIRRRDPAHPKPNRSGYNFFFAEQHARLKPLYPGKDREISRMIGELWNKLKDDEKSIYKEKAIRDKERYQIEKKEYRERLKTNQVISDAVPIQQRFPHLDVKDGMIGREILDENGSTSSKSEGEDEEEDEDGDYENFSDMEASLAVSSGGVELGDINVGCFEASAAQTGDVQVVQGCEQSAVRLDVPEEQNQVQHDNSVRLDVPEEQNQTQHDSSVRLDVPEEQNQTQHDNSITPIT